MFGHKSVEHGLVEPAIERHRKLFGDYPKELTADRGYDGRSEQLATLREKIDLVAINKKEGKNAPNKEPRENKVNKGYARTAQKPGRRRRNRVHSFTRDAKRNNASPIPSSGTPKP